ncbi:hypothetical protein Tco_1234023 [Tanacetum coccineum]
MYYYRAPAILLRSGFFYAPALHNAIFNHDSSNPTEIWTRASSYMATIHTGDLYLYLPAHPPPAPFASLFAQQLPMHYYRAPAMSPALVFYAPALPHAFHTMTLQNPNWNMDTGASSYLADNTGILTSFSTSSMYPYVFVGNGHSVPITHTGHSLLHTSSKPLHLNHILVTPHIIKNLNLVHQFTRNNDVSVEFDAYGFSVKDYQTG